MSAGTEGQDRESYTDDQDRDDYTVPEITRHASPQAWRRIRRAIGPGEAPALATDIAAVVERDDHMSLRDAIEFALTGEPWDRRVQS